MIRIYMMGFDVWRDTLDAANYLQSCQGSKKYQAGTWFVLESGAALLASMLVYQSGYALPANAIGFGSIATAPESRGQGFGSALIRGVLAQHSSTSAIYLHSDIGSSFYEQFGFVAIFETHPGTMCMVRQQSPTSSPSPVAPRYF
tara:strand:- start:155523 stop:155957 length:435 start_codon:yes stop_codon:yes gene_type:complete